ncbi:MAG: TIGR00730 family Rossman fold protein [Bacteroidales bacterium]|nr:TIGR00730 family Rossman fold protein [Bacteroidales bacterium]
MRSSEDKIKKAFKHKTWNEIKASDSWQIFKVMAEFVEGFEKMATIGPCVSIFGSARTEPESKYYELAKEIAFKLTQNGYGVITGGGPGIMEAANRGAKEGNGISVGLNIHLPFEQSSNPYIDHDKLITFKHFFVRKVMFQKYAQGFIVLPGGFGTFDEFFESATLIQTGKIGRFPIVLVGSDFWEGLVNWIEKTVQLEEKNISSEDRELFRLVDTAEEAVDVDQCILCKVYAEPQFLNGQHAAVLVNPGICEKLFCTFNKIQLSHEEDKIVLARRFHDLPVRVTPGPGGRNLHGSSRSGESR